MTPLVVDPSGYLKPHHSVGHCPKTARFTRVGTPPGQSRTPNRHVAKTAENTRVHRA